MITRTWRLAQPIRENSLPRTKTNAREEIPARDFGFMPIYECIEVVESEVAEEFRLYNETSNFIDQLTEEANRSWNPNYEALHEATNVSLLERIKGVFKKIIAGVKGIINKISAHFSQMSGNTVKWLEIMEPKIKKTKDELRSARNVTVEMYEWDVGYLKNSITTGFNKLRETWYKHVIETSKEASGYGDKHDITYNKPERAHSHISSMYRTDKDTARTDTSRTGSDSDQTTEEDTRKQNDRIEQLKEAQGKFKTYAEGLPAQVVKDAGTSYSITVGKLSEIRDKMFLRLHGGSNKKKTIRPDSYVDAWLRTIRDSSDILDSITEDYEKYLKALEDTQDEVIKIGDEAELKGQNLSSTLINAHKEYIKAYYDYIKETIRLYGDAMNAGREVAGTAMQDILSDYMHALTTYASKKPTSEDKRSA